MRDDSDVMAECVETALRLAKFKLEIRRLPDPRVNLDRLKGASANIR